MFLSALVLLRGNASRKEWLAGSLPSCPGPESFTFFAMRYGHEHPFFHRYHLLSSPSLTCRSPTARFRLLLATAKYRMVFSC